MQIGESGSADTGRGRCRAAAVLLALALLAPGAARAQDEAARRPYDDLVLLRVPPGGTEVLVEELIRDIGERLGKVVVIDEAIATSKKRIKFYTSAELNFYMLVQILRFYGFELVFKEVDGRQILEAYMDRSIAQSGKRMPTPLVEQDGAAPKLPQVVTAVYSFQHADPNGAQNVIRVMQGQDPRRVGNVFLVPNTPMIVITDLSDAVDFYLDICRRLDSPVPELTYKIVQVHYALADELAQLVNALHQALVTGAAPAAAPGQQAGQPQPIRRAPGQLPGTQGTPPGQVVADVRTNKLVILAVPEEIAALERLVRELDVKVPPPPRHFHIYKCINADAAELAERLNALFGGASFTPSQDRRTSRRDRLGGGLGGRTGGLSGLGSTRTGLGAGRFGQGFSGLRLDQPQGQAARPALAAPGGAAPPGAELNPGQGVIETRIVPDVQTNSLLIQAAPDDYEQIMALVQELDKKRLRVLIEAQVWEVSVSDDLFFAVDAAYTDDASTHRNPNPLRGHGFSSFGLLAPSVDPADPSTLQLLPNLDPAAGGSLLSGGLIAALTKGGFDRIPLIIQALARESNANLVTSPFAMTNDGETAVFQIEQAVPFQVATSTSVSAFQGFDVARAISALEITPRVASGTNLTLDIVLDIESFGEQASPLAPPESNRRSYTGVVTVPNQSYVVFGGLEQEVVREVRRKIPLLGDIPLLGYLFGSTSRSKERRRIYVFVRPVIFLDENFAGERKAAAYLQNLVRGQSELGARIEPVLPDDVIEAPAPGARADLFHLFQQEGLNAFPEDGRTRAERRAVAEGR
ncbi:MAG: hypothetical protein KatS3mg102_1084 [Planctomycetota bacterium]|nr:MAG: hypothetical protein KatS3mg102_1084 [Planctomycetota bacterium]